MPLVERKGDWNTHDGTHDDPHTLAFDHRIEASEARDGPGLAGVERNVKATCVLTYLKPDFGWSKSGDNWTYEPTANGLNNMETRYTKSLPLCIEYEKYIYAHAFEKSVSGPLVMEHIRSLDWPLTCTETDGKPATEYVSRFPLGSQWIIGDRYASGYHLGSGYIGTAGHCLDDTLRENRLGDLKVVFNWAGDVMRKRVWTSSEIFEVEEIVKHQSHGLAPRSEDVEGITRWASEWDFAIFKSKGSPAQFSSLQKVDIAAEPPHVGTPVYNIGTPLGTQLKVSPRGQILRYSTDDGSTSPSPAESESGTYTTDLDQFGGNSGGPVIDSNTGLVVGHISSTQDTVSDSSIAAIETWEQQFLSQSRNYGRCVNHINPYLATMNPTDESFRVHPKHLRHLLGAPMGDELIRNTTHICPGDVGPNGTVQREGRYQAVFSRHHSDSSDVWRRNVTARVDRLASFMEGKNN